ncbi:MAG: TorF family putative porin [Pseudobdellovibrionaceae bacterium]
MQRYIVFFITIFGLPLLTRASDGESSSISRLSGNVKLVSHYVENGLSQSDKAPAIQGSFSFNMGPQFRLGLDGSNTAYKTSNDHFNLRLNAALKIDFSSTSNIVVGFSQSQYLNSGDHNGTILNVNLNFDSFRIIYQSFSNWEATNKSSVRYGVAGTKNLSSSWKWNNEIGYNKPTITTYDPYFDVRTGLGTKLGSIFTEGALSTTNQSSQFNGRGSLFFILSATMEL